MSAEELRLEPHNTRGYLCYNPNNLPHEELPTIWGFINSVYPHGDVVGCLIADDGEPIGSHLSSSDSWSKIDLGVSHPSKLRHERFQAHYPGGYKMEFVAYQEFGSSEGLQIALRNHSDNFKPKPKKEKPNG